MRARWGAALAAMAAVAASAGTRAADGGSCELGRTARSVTPSRGCMSCHDGSAGPAVPFQMTANGLGMSHPVEIDYAAATAAQSGKYQPVTQLPPEVPLVAGRVECTTCHDGRSRDPKRVAAVRDLCLACHLL